MEFELIGNLVLFVIGITLIFLSYQTWYIDWVNERVPIERNKLIRGERISGIGLMILGLMQTIKTLI